MTNSLLSVGMILWFLLLSSTGMCHRNQDPVAACGGHRCGHHGPLIRFPFRLKDKEPLHCGYPGFDLTCDNQDTLIEISNLHVSIKLIVTDIYYYRNYVWVSYPGNCLPNQLLKLANTSIPPFLMEQGDDQEMSVVSFFNCPQNQFSSCPIYASNGWIGLPYSPSLLYCTKMFDISFRSSVDIVDSTHLRLRWSKPNCGACEMAGKHCKLKSNGTDGDVECFVPFVPLHHKPQIITKVALDDAGVVVGSILLLLVVATACFKTSHHYRMKGEDRARIEKFLEDYRALKPTRFSYADIKRITNGFKDKLGEGAHGAVFKGMLSSEIIVAVKILNSTEGEGKDFTNEIGTMGKIHHVNVVRLLGFCAQGLHRALVYEFFPKGSLDKFISTPDNKDVFLGWEILHQIVLGVARGIEYLHLGCEQQILHFDINPHNVLLDDKFTPKITDFGLAKLCSKNQSKVSMTAARGTLGYIAPEVVSRNFGNVSYKSDIYSYGMLLLEMVGGRKNVEMAVERPLQVLYPEWVHNLLDGGDIQLQIENEQDFKIAQKIAIVGLWCIQWHPSERPSIKTVIQMLEGDGDKLTVPRNPFHSTSSASTSGTRTIPKRLNLELEMIQE